MSTPPLRLGTSSYILLGAIAQAGPCSPYELKRVVAQLVGPLWALPHSQVYDEAARLAKAGLLAESQEGSGRRKLSYAVTDAGRRELLRWLRVPSRERMELRDVGMVKLAFASELAPGEVAELAADHLAAWQIMRAELDALLDAAGSNEAGAAGLSGQTGPAGPAELTGLTRPAGQAGPSSANSATIGGPATVYSAALADAAIAFWQTLSNRLGQAACAHSDAA